MCGRSWLWHDFCTMPAREMLRKSFSRCRFTSTLMIAKRPLATGDLARRGGYIDEWFASIIKPKSFYEEHADEGREKRCYFYNIDLQGRLFLEETMPKNITSCIKDTRFLNFFFRRLQRVDTEQRKWMEANGISAEEYPFVSPCGAKEWNMVRPAAVPIVFHTLTEQQDLLFGGDMTEPFDENNGIAISRLNGRLYHKLRTHSMAHGRKRGKDSTDELSSPTFGLIRSSIAVSLSDRIIPLENSGKQSEELSDMGFETASNKLLPIPWLPLEAEPGPWGMPYHEEQ